MNVLSECQARRGRLWPGVLTFTQRAGGKSRYRLKRRQPGNIHIAHMGAKGEVADQEALEQFQQQWTTYQKLVDEDALAHKEVGKILHFALKAIPAPFAFLDIACGDSGQMAAALAGIDLSEPALELAAKKLGGAPFEIEFDHRDFVTALTRRPEPAGAAWSVCRSITSRPRASLLS